MTTCAFPECPSAHDLCPWCAERPDHCAAECTDAYHAERYAGLDTAALPPSSRYSELDDWPLDYVVGVRWGSVVFFRRLEACRLVDPMPVVRYQIAAELEVDVSEVWPASLRVIA